jgi:hypothetical protein
MEATNHSETHQYLTMQIHGVASQTLWPWYWPPHSQCLPVFLRVSLYRIFLAVFSVTRITLSLNTKSKNRNIMTDQWMIWHFIQGSAVRTGWVCEPVTCPQNITALHLSKNYLLNSASAQSFRISIERKCVYLHFARLEWVFRSSNLTFRGPCIVIYSYNKSQQDGLFLSFILINSSTYFGQTYCP